MHIGEKVNMYLVSAYFDEESDRIIRRHIERVADKTGNSFMLDNAVPPHMTISSLEARSADVLIPAFESLAHKITAGKTQVVSMGQMLPYVFYLTPLLNEYLTEVSETVFEAFADIPDVTVNKFYRPGSWLPHITIAKTLTKEQMRTAFEVMQNGFALFDAGIVRMGLSKVNPHEDVRSMELYDLISIS